ncbi:MAG: hypothetical protein AAB383_01105 [Patescibacteria group bacterium]
MNMDENISQKTDKNKAELIEQLRKTPIVQIACEKVGVGRASYYRWRKEDEKFAEEADEALCRGKSLVNDMAESQLLKAVRDGNMTGIIFWLKNNHPDYKTRVELSGELKTNTKLTLEQEEQITTALKHAGLLLPSNLNSNEKN